MEAECIQLASESVTGNSIIDALNADQLRAKYRTGCFTRSYPAYCKRLNALTKLRDNSVTIASINRLNSRVSNISDIRSEADSSSQQDGNVDSSNMYSFQNMVDVVGTIADETKSGDSTNSRQGQSNVLGLDGFLSRPIPITTFQVAVAANTSVTLDVWDLYTLEPSVRAKLRNFAYLRGNLNVRIAISGTPFHYGRFMISYQPWPLKNATLVAHRANLALEPSFYRFNYLNYLSQSPGAKCVDVRDNQPVDIVIPYISTKPMHRLFNTSAAALSAATSYQDLENAGSLMIYSVAPLGCVSASPSDISVYVYAWLTEVELGTQTATQIDITTEADERESGPVEKVSSRMASYMGYLSKVPVIGPYASASKVALSAVSSVASLFGWARPIYIDNPQLVKNQPYQNGSHTIGSETSYKISLDPKQELTVDPRVMGSGEDEMCIAHICQRESLLTTFTWADNSAIMGTPIFNCAVTPKLNTYAPIVSTIWVQPTALSFAANPFAYWRGSITFRLDIIASAFHRGKLAVYYEPNVNQATIIDAAISTNKQYIRIIDIQQTQSVEFDVEWAHPRAWARNWDNADAPATHGTFFDLDGMQDFCNGYIGVTPLTSLQSPDDSDIYVNVFVYSKDMHFNFMDNSYLPTARDVITEADLTFTKDVSTITLNPSTATCDLISQEHFGEEPISFRSLLKRYAGSAVQSISADATTEKLIQVNNRIIPGPLPTYGTTTVSFPVNLFNYLRYAYVGMRGGIRKRIEFSGLTVGTGNKVTVWLNSLTTSTGLTTSISAITNMRYLLVGAVHFIMGSNGGIEVELPYYSNNLYSYSFSDDDLGTTVAGLDVDSWVRRFSIAIEALAATPALYYMEASASAEDFSFLRYQGAPYYTMSA